MINERTKELVARLVAVGSFPHMSASEGHELYDGIMDLIEDHEDLIARYAFSENQRLCIGYRGGCDGDLADIEHDYCCAARVLDVTLRPHLYPPLDER
jgi:hypothetical protein